jgi:hypothetical protein
MPSSTSRPGFRSAGERRQALALWTGTLAGPLVWLTLLQTNYTLSYVACETRQTWFLHLAIAIGAFAVGAAGLWGWRAGHAASSGEISTAPVSEATRQARIGWMAVLAALTSAFFIVVIIAMSIPVVVLKTCQ